MHWQFPIETIPNLAAGPFLAVPLLAFAAWRDILFRLVPNWVPLFVLAVGLALRAYDHDLAVSALVGSALFAAAIPLWSFGLFGGADVKLLAAGSTLFAPAMLLSYCAGIALAGGVLSLFYLALRAAPAVRPTPRHGRPVAARLLRIERLRIARSGSVPYAVAILGGVSVLMVQGL